MSVRRRHRKQNNGIRGGYRHHETVYVSSPCNTDNNDKSEEYSCNTQEERINKTVSKSKGFSLKNILGNFFGSSTNDDLIILVLIVMLFLSRRKSAEEEEPSEKENKEFSVTDFITKASDMLKKFNDNDILLVALLYILL